MRSATARAACAICCAALGHESELYALTIDDDLADEVRPFSDPAARRGDVTIFHYALPSPMTEAFASLRARPRPAVSQRHAGGVSSRPTIRRCSGWRRSAAQELATLVGRVDLALGVSEYNRQELEALGFAPTGVLPLAVDTSRITQAAARPALEQILDDELRQLPVRRPDRAEQEDRGSHPPRRALQALRRRLLPLHLRRPLRCGAALLFDDSGADVRVPAAGRALHLHRPGARRGARRLLPARGGLHLDERARRLLRAAASRRWPPTCRSWPTRRRPCRKRSAGPACSSRRRTSNTPPSCSARWPSTTTCAPRSSPASAGGWPISATRRIDSASSTRRRRASATRR